MQAHSLIEDLKFENTKLKQENAMFKTNTSEFVKTYKDKDYKEGELKNELNMVYAKMDKMDQDFSDLWSEKKEIEERCKMLESELNQRDFDNRDNQGYNDPELQNENV